MAEDALLYRQIHPDWIFPPGEETQSRAFRPTAKDGDFISVYNGSNLSPEESYRHYTEVLELQSAGVLGISFAEVQSLGIPIKPDPQPDHPSHTLLDFSGLATNAKKRLAARDLNAKALQRGWLYQP